VTTGTPARPAGDVLSDDATQPHGEAGVPGGRAAGSRPGLDRPGSAAPMWLQVFAIAVLVHASGAFFAVLDPPGSPTRPAVLVIWTLFYAVAAVLLLDGRVRHRRRLSFPPVLALYAAWAGTSVLWSVDPALSLRRAIGLVGTALVALLLAQRMTPAQLFGALRRALLLVAGCSLLLYVLRVPAGLDDVHGTLRGVLATKNTLGQVMAVGLLACVAGSLVDRRSTRRNLLSAAPMAAALALTDSTAGLVTGALVVAVAAVTVLRRGVVGRMVLVGSVTLVAGVLMVTLPGTSPGQVADVVGEDTTLTGRDVIWAQSAQAAAERPVAGYGYGAFWEGWPGDEIRFWLEWDVPHAHNGLLDVWLDLGVVGALLALLLLGSVATRGVRDLRAGRTDVAALRLSVAGLVLVSNLVESAFLQQNSLLAVLLVCAAAARTGASRGASRPEPDSAAAA
jgi:exopolysaccharide production protein ExoQ